MKRVFSLIMVCLLCLSTFSIFAPKAKADSAYLTDIVQLTTNPYDDRGAGWFPDSSKIAYSAFADSWYRHIWVMNSDGSNKKQLTFGNVVDEAPAYSPDGTKIVFMRYGLRGIDGSDLMMMNADGTNIQQLTSSGLHRGQPRWSHDSQRLAFYYGGAGTTTNEIHIMNTDGTNEVTVVSGTYSVMNPYWSPDDTKLVCTMDDGIWVVNTSQPYQKTRVFQTSLPTMYAVYSPDGKYIMYASGVYGQLQDLYLIDIYGNFIAQLTYDTKFGYVFDWSPDGQYIAFNSISSGNYDVWRARIVILHPNLAAINNLVNFQQVATSDPPFSVQQNFIVASPASLPPFHDDFDSIDHWIKEKWLESNYSYVWPSSSILHMYVPPNEQLRNKLDSDRTFRGDCLSVEVRFRVDNPQQQPNYAIFLIDSNSAKGAKYQELDWEYNPSSAGRQQITYYYDNNVQQPQAHSKSLTSPWNKIEAYSAWTVLKFVLRPDHVSIYINGQYADRFKIQGSTLGGFDASNMQLVVETTDLGTLKKRPLATASSELQVDFVDVDSSAMYWVQNIVSVSGNIPIISKRLISSAFRVFDMPEMTHPWQAGSIPKLASFPVVFNLTSYIDGNLLLLQNNASLAFGTAKIIVPSGSYIDGDLGPIYGFTHQTPELVIVGGPYQHIATFVDPTTGTVNSLVRLIGESAWRQTQNVVLNLQNHPQTAEESRNLKWSSDGAFQYSGGRADQGITFFP